MAAINKFYQFATLASSDNILSDGQYEADDQRLSGNVPGIARQQLVNKCLKQAAAIAYAFGEAASVNNNMEVSDDGAGLTNITDYLTKALLPGYSASDANKYARINSQGTGIVYVTIPPASTTVAGLTRYATTTEANAGTIADAAVTPAGLKAFSDGHQNITGNAATASKLQTARTITLSGNDASGSVSFDGSANVQLPVAVAQATKLRTPRSIGISAFNAQAVPFDGTANIDLGVDSIPVNLLDGVISQANLPVASATGAGIVSIGAQTIAGAKTFSDGIVGSLSGNASTATKLATPRTISITGAGTGSVAFDGSADVSLTLAIPDASTSARGLVSTDAQIFTGQKTFNGGIKARFIQEGLYTGNITGTYIISSSYSIQCVTCTAAVAITASLSIGQTVTLVIANGGGKATFSGIKWAGGTAPTLTDTGVDILTFIKPDDSNTYGIAATDFK